MMNKNFMNVVSVKNVVADVVIKADRLINKADYGRLVKVCCWIDRPLVSYGGDVNSKANEKFVPLAPKGFIYTKFPFFKQAIKSGIEYLVINFRGCDKGSYEEKYYLDGLLISSEVAKTMMKEKKSYAPKRQIEVGVTNEKEQTSVAQYELTKIRYIGLEKNKAIQIYESVGD